ncbi:hypothetical protein [Oerskovia gallyi]|uniref:Uncharacterized protein n=1 Tax=Oerskovia gallyi TaxID=2762226 RepID=A0ABR8V310_9CELL|nr:hypothetical protein [Oerskovia gallyi]MBD7998946.1 hypothetical protein [Oerskovia gallyi]
MATSADFADLAPVLLVTHDAVGFDPEGGMLSVYGTDLDALLVAARHLSRIIADDAALDAALARSVALGLDD